jgi:xanthine dehydrogenase molybdopterin-binding subunit B
MKNLMKNHMKNLMNLMKNLIKNLIKHQVPSGQPKRDPVGRPIVVQSAFQQCTGEARFLDDMPSLADALHLYPVLSTRAKARIIAIDTSAAESVDGYVGIVTADDIPSKSNSWGIFGDDKIFYSDEVRTVKYMFKEIKLHYYNQIYLKNSIINITMQL